MATDPTPTPRAARWPLTWEQVRALDRSSAATIAAHAAVGGAGVRQVRSWQLAAAAVVFAAAVGPVGVPVAVALAVVAAVVTGAAGVWWFSARVDRLLATGELTASQLQGVVALLMTDPERYRRYADVAALLGSPPGEVSCAAFGRHTPGFCPHHR